MRLSLSILSVSKVLKQFGKCPIHISKRYLHVPVRYQWINPNQGSRMIGTIRQIVTSSILKADIEPEMVDVTFVRGDGSKITTKGKVGDNLLDVVVNNNVDLDGYGACEGTLACSTCHLVFKKQDFEKIQEKLTDEELDMLDMAYGLTDTSRLGCQVCLTKELGGVEVVVPAGVNDQRS